MRSTGICVLAMATLACRSKELEVIDLRNLDDGGAIVTFYDRAQRETGVARIGPDGATSWSERSSDLALSSPWLWRAITVDHDRVVVPVRSTEGQDGVQARALDDGRLLWGQPLRPHDTGVREALFRIAPVASHDALVACLDHENEAVCLDANGGVARRTPVYSCGGMVSFGSRTFVEFGLGVTVLDGCIPKREPTWFRGCVVDGNYVAAESTRNHQYSLLVLRGGDPAQRSSSPIDLGTTSIRLPDGTSSDLEDGPEPGCFGYRGDAILNVRHGHEHQLVRVTMDGRVVGRATVGDRFESRWRVHEEHEGADSRFVPLVDMVAKRLRVVDLEKMEIASQIELDMFNHGTWTAHLGDTWYVAIPHHSGRDGLTELMRLDGQTGRVTAAVWVNGFVGAENVRIANGTVWLFSQDTFSKFAVARLDPVTLQPIFTGPGIGITDASDDERLGALR